MARYIDADAFEQKLADKDIFFPALFKNELNNIPTADVVPKSEVDLYKRQVDELEDELASTYDKLENAKVDVAREIFEEIEDDISDTISRLLVSIDLREKETSDVNDHDVLVGYGRLYALRNIEELFAELKKKYMGGT